ncbi:hypothetical protein AAZX31_10G253900 [Glycine max]
MARIMGQCLKPWSLFSESAPHLQQAASKVRWQEHLFSFVKSALTPIFQSKTHTLSGPLQFQMAEYNGSLHRALLSSKFPITRPLPNHDIRAFQAIRGRSGSQIFPIEFCFLIHNMHGLL